MEIATRAYYQPPTGATLNQVAPQDVLASLLPLFVGCGSSTIKHGAETFAIGNEVTMNLTVLLNFITNTQNGIPDDEVKAYLNYITFDYQFKPVYCGTMKAAENLGAPQNLYTFIPITKNGYIYVWLSNATTVDVDFDNLTVNHYTGKLLKENGYYPFNFIERFVSALVPLWGYCTYEYKGVGIITINGIKSNIYFCTGTLLEENTYFPFGLSMSRISAMAALKQSCNLKYNDKELQAKYFNNNTGLEWLDYVARMYDQQIGRWQVVNLKAEKYLDWSFYNCSFCNPIRFVDPDKKNF